MEILIDKTLSCLNFHGFVEVSYVSSKKPEDILYKVQEIWYAGDITMAPKKDAGNGSVGISLGITMNMGNFEFVRVSVWGTSPVSLNESRDVVLQELTEWAENKVEVHRKAVRGLNSGETNGQKENIVKT